MNYEMNLNNESVTTINLDNAHENNNQLKSSTEHTIYVYKLELTADLKIQKRKIKEFKTAKSNQK